MGKPPVAHYRAFGRARRYSASRVPEVVALPPPASRQYPYSRTTLQAWTQWWL